MLLPTRLVYFIPDLSLEREQNVAGTASFVCVDVVLVDFLSSDKWYNGMMRLVEQCRFRFSSENR